MIKIIAQFHFKETEINNAVNLAKELVEASRKEEGCVQYDLLQSESDSALLVILETWASAEVLDVHSASEHFTRIVPQLSAMCTQSPAVDKMTLLM